MKSINYVNLLQGMAVIKVRRVTMVLITIRPITLNILIAFVITSFVY